MRSGCSSSSAAFARLTLAGVVALVMTFFGCGGGGSMNPVVHGVHLKGIVHGGQQPVVGATITLYTVGTSGYGSAATALFTTSTGAGGAFDITGHYSCATASQVYIVATSGDAGSGMNSAISMMAGLGDCTALSSVPFIEINELTTVASVYALAPFMTGAANVGASLTNATGITNAFTTIKSLINIPNSNMPGPGLPANGTAPIAEINTLADILAPCVNSSGAGAPCSTLFAAATPSGGSAPTNTLDAMLDIAHNPATVNVAGLYSIATPTSPFQPTLSSAPTDWTLPIKFTGGGLNSPNFLAIDALGDVWASNNGASSVSELDNFGNALSPASGFTGGGLNNGFGIAVDGLGNVWVADRNNPGALTEFDSSGNAVAGSPFSGGGLENPAPVVVDGGGNIWSGSFDGAGPFNALNKFSSLGVALSGSGYTDPSLNNPVNLAVVPVTGNVWAVNENGNSLTEFTNAGVFVTTIPGSVPNGLSSPQAIALDNSGNLWVADASGDVSELSSTGATLNLFFSGVQPTNPSSMVIDGVGNIWIPDASRSAVLEMSPSGNVLSESGGFTAGGTLSVCLGSAIDGSGNLWIPNLGTSSITKIVGVAAPVVTPLATAVANNTLATRP